MFKWGKGKDSKDKAPYGWHFKEGNNFVLVFKGADFSFHFSYNPSSARVLVVPLHTLSEI